MIPAYIAVAAGIAGFAFRSAANQPHPIYVGLGVAALVFAITFALRAVDRAF